MLQWFAIAAYNPSLSGCKEPSFVFLPVSVGVWGPADLAQAGMSSSVSDAAAGWENVFSLQLCGSMGMTLHHVSLLLLGPASQPGHVFLKRWQRCKRAKRNMFAKPRLRAQVLSLQLIYHWPAGVAGLSPESWSIKGGTLGEALARIWM